MPPEPQRTKRLPIYRNAGFLFDTIGEAADVFAREEEYPQSADRFSYSRYGNPNVAETEEQLAEIEGAEWAVLTASGMAAIDTALSVFQRGEKTGPWLFFSELYGGTNDYIQNILIGRRGHRCRAVPSGGGRGAVRSRPARGPARPRGAVPPVLRAGHEPAFDRLGRRQGHRDGEGARDIGGRGQHLRDLSPLATAGARGRYRRPQRDQVPRRARQPDGGSRVRERYRHPQGRHAVPEVRRKHPQRRRRLPPQHAVEDIRAPVRGAVRERLQAGRGDVRASRRRARPLSRPRVAPDARRGREDVRASGVTARW